MRPSKHFPAAVMLLAGCSPLVAVGQSIDTEPVLVFDQRHELLEDNTAPMVQVYRDGRVLVTRAPIYKRAGQYELSISSSEVEALLALAASAGDAPENASQLQTQQELPDGSFTGIEVADSTRTIIHVNTDGANEVADGAAVPFTGEIVADDVNQMADAAPQDSSLSSLDELRTRLLALFARGGAR